MGFWIFGKRRKEDDRGLVNGAREAAEASRQASDDLTAKLQQLHGSRVEGALKGIGEALRGDDDVSTDRADASA